MVRLEKKHNTCWCVCDYSQKVGVLKQLSITSPSTKKVTRFAEKPFRLVPQNCDIRLLRFSHRLQTSHCASFLLHSQTCIPSVVSISFFSTLQASVITHPISLSIPAWSPNSTTNPRSAFVPLCPSCVVRPTRQCQILATSCLNHQAAT